MMKVNRKNLIVRSKGNRQENGSMSQLMILVFTNLIEKKPIEK